MVLLVLKDRVKRRGDGMETCASVSTLQKIFGQASHSQWKSKISFNNWHFLFFCLFVFCSTSQVFGKWNYNMNLNWFLIKEQTALVHLTPHSLKRFHGFQTWWTAEFRVRSEGCNHCSCSTVTQFTAFYASSIFLILCCIYHPTSTSLLSEKHTILQL